MDKLDTLEHILLDTLDLLEHIVDTMVDTLELTLEHILEHTLVHMEDSQVILDMEDINQVLEVLY